MIGTATEPTVEQTVELVATCKQQTIVNIKIRNWLGSRQAFNATYTILQLTGGHGLQVQAPTFLDVPGGQIRDYRFSVFALKPCNSVIRFQFTNPSTGDFTLADARIQFNEGGSMGTINFNGNTRQLYRHRLEIENPSSKRASIQCTSTHQEISFLPQSFAIAPQSTSTVDILMRPTVPGSGEASVSLTSEELGLFKYLVKYEMKNPGVEKRITFSAPLGRDSQQYVRFMHFGKKATVYQISLEFPAEYSLPQRPANAPDVFILESKLMQLQADTDGQGIEICVPVKFVPSRLQDTKAILCIRGAEGQEYKALLVGRATAPEAQGPIKVPKGKGLLIEFKNPLDTATEFAAQVDQPVFSIDKKSFRLEPRKSTTLTVAMKTEAKATGNVANTLGIMDCHESLKA
ncbi:hypothetical protein, conserved [Eimeria necatrix]|uniref:Uncharacterized protein n=1 Tax=Eimeria necatrix TaxID=51315 RepID=U6MM64_9EIME|nr:hypothetical protein, conserved [Eimeria necatrix]CDJ63529.1 hypothetical protein, conserved [Eimeria necatrix]